MFDCKEQDMRLNTIIINNIILIPHQGDGNRCI
jgi:hypothetical protein